MKLAVVQHDIAWEQPEKNFARLAGLVAEAAGAGAGLVVLAEMFSYGFSMDVAKIAEAPDGPSSQFLIAEAQKHNIWLGGTVPVLAEAASGGTDESEGKSDMEGTAPWRGGATSGRADESEDKSDTGETAPGRGGAGSLKARNTFVLAAPDGSTYSYAKIHPFTYGGEDEHYEGGDSLKQVQVEDIRVSLSVCYDLRFPYVFWPLADTTDLYLVPANWPAKRRQHWQSLLVARAIENQAYVAGINRVGTGGGINYCGDSAIISPLGETISSASPPIQALSSASTPQGQALSSASTPPTEILGSASPPLAQTDPTSKPETDDSPPTEADETILYAEIDPQVVASTRSRFPFIQDRRDIPQP